MCCNISLIHPSYFVLMGLLSLVIPLWSLCKANHPHLSSAPTQKKGTAFVYPYASRLFLVIITQVSTSQPLLNYDCIEKTW
jgi:hypothetical protein